MILARAALCLCLAAAWPAAVGADPAGDARRASAALEDASRQLAQASTARDQVKALTRTVQAFEAGLGALRDGMRQAAAREAELETSLAAREAETAALAGALLTISAAPPPVLLAHPDGPLGAARSGMMLAEIAPALEAKVDSLKDDLAEIRDLQLLQSGAAETLRQGLIGVQDARAELSRAMADRTDLPVRFVDDPIQTALLIAATETLDAFASGLWLLTDAEIAAAEPGLSARMGTLPLPVAGRLLRKAKEADAAGVERPGVLVATQPRALVVAPTSATIRYAGPLLDLGNVVILEPDPTTLFILSGLAEVYGHAGEVIPEGSPVGLMGGPVTDPQAVLSPIGDGAGTERPETLYIEVRQDGVPVDPASWFQMQ
ncbi:murein hydrolase activator EnvC family protein [Chachezhania sediminis]|uniref:murein hydrolase activator EnvC family protein n=1 Tax=Chachezhania sediminis TaxID=2599291 RepID=UPI001E477CCF|nr:peptidase M23 [Chachezhania sediminis]